MMWMIVVLVLLCGAVGYFAFAKGMMMHTEKTSWGKDEMKAMEDDHMMKKDDGMMMTGSWTKEEMEAMEKDHMMMAT
jgi:hypothetical protein